MTTSGTYKFYVYEHWRLDRDECFYVGKGKGRRAYDFTQSRNKYYKAIVAKVLREGSAIDVRIVQSGLSESEAFDLERNRIKFWRESGVELSNFTNGGEGTTGLVMSQDARAKMRLAKLGKKQTPEQIERRVAPLRGRTQPRDAIERGAAKRRGSKLSQAHKDRISVNNKGKSPSPEVRIKLSVANKGKPWSEKRRQAYLASKMELIK